MLVLCSDSENFGMSVAEALACGVPPVVTRTCPWEVLERETRGFVGTANAGGDRRRASCDSWHDPAEARAMGERGRRLVEHHFALPVVGERGRSRTRRKPRARDA